VIYTDSQHVDSDFVESWYPDATADSRLHKINDWFELNYTLSTDTGTYSYDDATLEAYQVNGQYRRPDTAGAGKCSPSPNLTMITAIFSP
jgi:hypothetical protein